MDQKLRSKGSLTSSVILVSCAIMAFVLGTPMLLSFPGEIWWIGLMLVSSAILVTITAIRIYYLAKKENGLFNQQLTSLNTRVNAEKVDNAKVKILVSWVYSTSEWNEFLKWEKKRSNSNTLTEVVLVIVLTTLGIHYLAKADWTVAVGISFVFGVVYILIKYLVNRYSIQVEENKMPEVIITNEAVIVNGYVNRFYGNNLWLGKVTVNDAGKFNVLEITYCWNISKGKAFKEIRVPIPKGSLKEAIFLQEKLMNKKDKLS